MIAQLLTIPVLAIASIALALLVAQHRHCQKRLDREWHRSYKRGWKNGRRFEREFDRRMAVVRANHADEAKSASPATLEDFIGAQPVVLLDGEDR